MSKTYPYKYEVGYAAIRSIQSKSTHNIISMQTYGYNYEYTQFRVASKNLDQTRLTVGRVKPLLDLTLTCPYLTDYVPMMLK